MTITTHDRFAIIPKRCDECNRLFIFEFYDIIYKTVGIYYYNLKLTKCKKCQQKGGGVND